MNPVVLKMKCALALAIVAILATSPVMAAKGGKHEDKDRRDEQRGEQRDERRDSDRDFSGQRRHFEDRHQVIVREYYDNQFRGGRCPPGLAKKHNGCMPPGQARKWQVGHPLPRDVTYYRVPQPLVVQIGAPPSGYRYVRVAGDILLIAIGTRMVVDSIQDLGGR
jgi:Ni/Co efflux regulator RcnB